MKRTILGAMMLGLVNINAGTTDALLQAAQKDQLNGHANHILNTLHTEAKDIGGYVKELAIDGKEKAFVLVNRAGKEIKRLSESDILAQAAKWAANARDVVAEKKCCIV